MRACVRACERACVRACVRACECVCVCVLSDRCVLNDRCVRRNDDVDQFDRRVEGVAATLRNTFRSMCGRFYFSKLALQEKVHTPVCACVRGTFHCVN